MFVEDVVDLLEGQPRHRSPDAHHRHGRRHEPVAPEGDGDVLVQEGSEGPRLRADQPPVQGWIPCGRDVPPSYELRPGRDPPIARRHSRGRAASTRSLPAVPVAAGPSPFECTHAEYVPCHVHQSRPAIVESGADGESEIPDVLRVFDAHATVLLAADEDQLFVSIEENVVGLVADGMDGQLEASPVRIRLDQSKIGTRTQGETTH